MQITGDIIEQYLNGTFKSQLAVIGVPDVFIKRIAATVREQMLSCVRHWNDESFRKTILFIGEEEGCYYLPKAAADVRKFVVVTLRNSALETIHADSRHPIAQGKRLTTEDLKAITSAAIEYFKEIDFTAMAARTGSLESDKYSELAEKYPVSWMALTMLANTTKQAVKYEPLPITAKPDLSILKPQQAVKETFFNEDRFQMMSVVADGYALTIDHGLQHILKIAVEDEERPFIVDSFKSVSRNIEKLLAVMEYVLCNERKFITSNYLIENGRVVRRMKPLKPSSDLNGMKRNWLNDTGLTTKHKRYLKTAAEMSF
jgi:hypothetical protein